MCKLHFSWFVRVITAQKQKMKYLQGWVILEKGREERASSSSPHATERMHVEKTELPADAQELPAEAPPQSER